MAVNCAAFPGDLAGERIVWPCPGGFHRSACGSKPGKFEVADGGTLLLDEVGEMPLSLQPKLLRALQEREFDRLGETRAVKVDMRMIATTNRRLEAMVREGQLSRRPVLPAECDSARFAAAARAAGRCCRTGRHILPGIYAERRPDRLPAVARARFSVRAWNSTSWPGRMYARLSRIVMRREVALSGARTIWSWRRLGSLGGRCRPGGPGRRPGGAAPAGLSLEDMERRLFEVTLDATGGNRSRAAEMLGVSLRTVRNKIRGYGLPPKGSYACP